MMKLIWLIIITVIINGCGLANKEGTVAAVKGKNTYYPIYIKNYTSNRENMNEIFCKKPERVIAHHQNIMEALMAIDEEETIVGGAFAGTDTREFSAQYKDKVKKLPEINGFNFDLETVLMYRPDLIIGWQSTFSSRLLRSTDFWHKRGVNTYIVPNSNSILPIGTVEDEYRFLHDIGSIFNRQKETAMLINEIKDEVAYVQKQTKGRKQQRVLIIEFMGRGITTYDKTRLCGDMVKKLGGQLIECGRNIDAETLITLNPDVIFVVNAKGLLANDAAIQKVYSNKAFKNIKAVKNNRVYPIPLIFMYASGTRTIDGIKTFRDGLYPEMKGW